MEDRFPATRWGGRTLILLLVTVAVLLSSDSVPVFNKHDRAFYRDAQVINFVRPGLNVTIVSASIADDGTITARFTLQDPRGLPLDRDGIFTPGPVSTSFIAAEIPDGAEQYVAYTTRVATSEITGNSATQASSDQGGTYTKNADGDYTYTFATKAPLPLNMTTTHTIGVYSERDLSEFDLGTDYADNTFNFVPGGGDVSVIRDVVATQSCNSCHNPLSAHGGARKSVSLCVMCHTPQSSDPDTGNTVDFKVMVHKIHRGENLPSVQAGTPYEIIGYRNSVHDFSDVVFPRDIRYCGTCHNPDLASQANHFLDANRAACGACHDDVNFATGENHVNLPQVSDSMCTQCHIPQGELEFDASILGAHTVPRFSKDLPGLVFDLLSVNDAAPGKTPTVTFKLSNKKGDPVQASDLDRLALVISGPTTAYQTIASEDARSATGSADGTQSYTFMTPLPDDAAGTYTVGIEGYREITLLPGTTVAQSVRDAGDNKVLSFSVDGSEVVPRRTVVETTNCNSCHRSLNLHGSNRNEVQQCVLCHNPTATDTSQRPADQGPPQAINFAQMIHKIHRGEDLTRPFTIYGYGGTPHDFTVVAFPGDLRDCDTCHVNESEEDLTPATAMITDPRGLINPVGRITSACTGCHTSVAAASHALSNTSTLGEACAACHGAGKDFAVSKVHAR